MTDTQPSEAERWAGGYFIPAGLIEALRAQPFGGGTHDECLAIDAILDACADGAEAEKPTPTPMLPWIEHPRAWWAVDSTDGWTSVLPSAAMTSSDPTGWTRVNAPTPFRGYVPISRKLVPPDLNLSHEDAIDALRAILDATMW